MPIPGMQERQIDLVNAGVCSMVTIPPVSILSSKTKDVGLRMRHWLGLVRSSDGCSMWIEVAKTHDGRAGDALALPIQ